MSTEQIEEVVVHSNVCLKRWENTKHTITDPRAMILSWLNRVYVRTHNAYQDRRTRKAISRGLHRSFAYTLSYEDGVHIDSITMRHPIDGQTMAFPHLNYEELNRRAKDILVYPAHLSKISDISFRSIEEIKFV